VDNINVLFQDDSILVLEKPPGLVVTSTNTHDGRTLEDILKEDFKIDIDRGGIVHRLDKDTSGVMIAAKTVEALENLQAQFKERSTKKEYLALVHGTMEKKEKVEGFIDRNPGNREKFTIVEDDEGGKESVTEFEPIDQLQINNERLEEIYSEFNKIQMKKLMRMNYNKFTLVKCFPLTGRTHQIRVHLKYLNLPIVGDDKYGGRKVVRIDHRWCRRQFLHAKRLEFTHPVSRERLVFESKLPDDLNLALSNLNGTHK
jgi:23S rRNA pseudouridine1911/1915/1917 synthase